MSYKRISPIPVTEGGTGLVTATTAYAPICGGTTATGAFQAASTGLSTAGYVLTSNGASALPSFQAPGGSGSITLTGDSGGGLTGSSFTITGGTSGAVFAGSGTTLTQSFNTVNLPTTTSSVGQIKINGDPVFHTYNLANVFIGSPGYVCGNFTTTGSGNIGLGGNALNGLTSGVAHVAIGYQCMQSGAVSGAYTNVAIGRECLKTVSSGITNTALGYQALNSLTTGQDNFAVGYQAGSAYTGAEKSNIVLNSPGVVGESNVLRIGTATGTSDRYLNKSFIHGIYGITAVGTTSSIPVIDSSGQLATGTPNSTTLSLSTDSTSTTANLFTGNAVKTVTIGSTNTTSTTTLNSGTGGVQVGTFLGLPATSSTAGQIKLNGVRYLHGYQTSNIFLGTNSGNFTLTAASQENVAAGYNTMVNATSGAYNTAIGAYSMGNAAVAGNGYNVGVGHGSLYNLTSGLYNVGVGPNALYTLSSGSGCIGIGREALYSASTATNSSMAIGYLSGRTITGDDNIMIGRSAAETSITTGTKNVGLGNYAFYNGGLTSGTYNIGIGYGGAQNLTTTDSHNICINNTGTAADSNVLRIGAATGTGTQQLNKSFIHGIRGITTVNNDAIAVLIDSVGQLGTVSSSIRYKENVSDMGDASSPVMNLRPVTFDFIGKPSHKKQVGLIAEEVKEIMPELVVHNQDGEVESVKYHELPVLLLNELKKLRARIEELEQKIK